MASIRKRNGRWQVQIRKAGSASLSKTFDLKKDALAWAREKERALDLGADAGAFRLLERLTFGDLLKRYGEEITPRKRGAPIEVYRIARLRQHQIAQRRLNALTSGDFARFREERLKTVQPGTVLRELSLVQRVLEVAIREWDVPLRRNPAKVISKPSAPPARERRLSRAEESRLLQVARQSGNKALYPAIALALETGMRRGEMMALTWDAVDLEQRLITIRQSKSGHARTIPISEKAATIIKGQPRGEEGLVFLASVNSLRLAWQRVVRKAEIRNLTFHDLRHEAISRFFEKGLSIPEVALISGHRDPRMLFRYTHLKASDLVEKL